MAPSVRWLLWLQTGAGEDPVVTDADPVTKIVWDNSNYPGYNLAKRLHERPNRSSFKSTLVCGHGARRQGGPGAHAGEPAERLRHPRGSSAIWMLEVRARSRRNQESSGISSSGRLMSR